MTKPRAFLFDVDDWLGSFTVEKMSGDQVKAYIYLLCRAWHETPIATLPNDDSLLARMARVSLSEWEVIKPEIMEQFKGNGNGRIYNPRLQKEAEYCKGRAKAGASGWTPARRAKQAEIAKRTTKQRTKQST
ncbi:MAG: DUF1376 domain-containing protein [Pyrinomonadaceae bacterium]